MEDWTSLPLCTPPSRYRLHRRIWCLWVFKKHAYLARKALEAPFYFSAFSQYTYWNVAYKGQRDLNCFMSSGLNFNTIISPWCVTYCHFKICIIKKNQKLIKVLVGDNFIHGRSDVRVLQIVWLIVLIKHTGYLKFVLFLWPSEEKKCPEHLKSNLFFFFLFICCFNPLHYHVEETRKKLCLMFQSSVL